MVHRSNFYEDLALLRSHLTILHMFPQLRIIFALAIVVCCFPAFSRGAVSSLWSMQVVFRDSTRAEIEISEGTHISFSAETLITGNSSIEVSSIDHITFVDRSDSVETVRLPDFSITVMRDRIEISGKPIWVSDVAVFDFNGVAADLAVSKAAPGKAVLDCSTLPAGYWILRVKDKSLKFHKK